MDLGELRRSYSRAGLRREDLDADPIHQFESWFDEASKAELAEPNAMVLATCGKNGKPMQRTVLLKAFDARGFVFYTNYESRKAMQIEENPNVSLHFLWLPLERQIAIAGSVQKVSTAESLKYFVSRPRGSRLGAWVSNQSSVINSRKLLEMKLDEVARKFKDGDVPLPSFWGGYRVVPESIEFWQGRENRLHDRFVYQRPEPGAEWAIDRLAP